jgi:hypothetical protein
MERRVLRRSPKVDVLFIGNDQSIELTGLQDAISEAYINDASVTATVKTKEGVAVTGQSWPLTLAYVAASDGNYRGNLEDGLELIEATMYVIEVTADCGGDVIGFWRFNRQAVYRTP